MAATNKLVYVPILQGYIYIPVIWMHLLTRLQIKPHFYFFVALSEGGPRALKQLQ